MTDKHPIEIGDHKGSKSPWEIIGATEEGQRLIEQFRVSYPLTYSKMEIDNNPDMLDVEAGRVTLRFESYILAERVAKDTYTDSVYVLFPASWWQHFKHTHADSWWLRWLVERRPVIQTKREVATTITVDRYLRYPKAALQTRDLGPAFVWEEPTMHTSVPSIDEEIFYADVETLSTREMTPEWGPCKSVSPRGLPCSKPNTIRAHYDGVHRAIGVDEWPLTVDEALDWHGARWRR